MCRLRSAHLNRQCLATREGGEHGGSSHGVLPEGLGNPCIGVGAGLTPVLTLACSLVELVVGVHRGLDLHCRASKSWGSFHKDDCRPLKIEIHAGWSEAHDLLGMRMHL